MKKTLIILAAAGLFLPFCTSCVRTVVDDTPYFAYSETNNDLMDFLRFIDKSKLWDKDLKQYEGLVFTYKGYSESLENAMRAELNIKTLRQSDIERIRDKYAKSAIVVYNSVNSLAWNLKCYLYCPRRGVDDIRITTKKGAMFYRSHFKEIEEYDYRQNYPQLLLNGKYKYEGEDYGSNRLLFTEVLSPEEEVWINAIKDKDVNVLASREAYASDDRAAARTKYLKETFPTFVDTRAILDKRYNLDWDIKINHGVIGEILYYGGSGNMQNKRGRSVYLFLLVTIISENEGLYRLNHEDEGSKSEEIYVKHSKNSLDFRMRGERYLDANIYRRIGTYMRRAAYEEIGNDDDPLPLVIPPMGTHEGLDAE